MSEAVQYRMVAGPSFEKLALKLAQEGMPQPNPLLSVGFVAEDEQGEIKGRIIVHSVPMIDYLHVDEGFRDGVGLKLFSMAEEFIMKSSAKMVYAYTKHETMKKLLLKTGAVAMDDTFFRLIR